MKSLLLSILYGIRYRFPFANMGFTYLLRFLVPLLYCIADTGQRLMHAVHLMHLLLTQTGFPSLSSMALSGQILSHCPQWMQSSVTLNFFVDIDK